MSRLLSSFVFFFFFAIQLSFGQLNVNFSTATPSPGENIEINVSVSNFVDIELFQFGIGWDSTVASFVSIANVTNVLPQFSEANNIGTPTSAALVQNGELSLSWSLNSTEPVTIPDGTVLFSIVVNVEGSECDETTFTVTPPPVGGNIEVFTNNLTTNIGAVSSGGLVSIPGTDCGGGGGNDGVGLIGSMESGLTGTQVCVHVTTENFSNIASLQTGITWDPAILNYVDVIDGALTGVSLNENEVSNGELKLLWIIGLGDDPVTVTDGTLLFDICFDILGSEGQMSDVSFVDLPNFSVEVADGDGISLDYFTQNGKVTVGEGGGEVEICDVGVGLIGDTLNTNGLTNICIPVTSKDFSNIASVQTGIVWDENILDLTEVVDGAMSGISVNALNADMGELKLLWIIGLGDDPVTVPDGTVLFELCFDVAGSTGQSTSVSFVDLPNFNIEIANGDGISEEYCTITSFVEITEDGGGGGETCDVGVGLIGDSLSTAGVANICMSVTAKDFTNIASVQTGILWDETVLDLTEVVDGAMSGISVNALNADMGELKLLWIIGLGDDPVTVADGTVLFDLCFDVVGLVGESSSISFVDLPNFNIEIANGEGVSEEYCTITGNIVITDDGGGGGETCDVGVGLLGDSLTTSGVSNICVPVTAKDFANIASVQTGIIWDESVIDYTGVNDGALNGISVNALEAGNGELKLLWIIGLGDDPVTVSDGTVLFELCFDVAGAVGETSDISFVDLPNFNIEIANGDGVSEEYCTITGFVEITGQGGGGEICPTGVGIIGDTLSIAPGSGNFCMPVTTKSFNDIASVQTGISWDPAVLQFTTVNEVNLTGVSLNTTNAPSGNIRFLWIIGLGDDPLTLADGEVLFELCFNPLGAEGTMSDVSFIDLPNFEVEVANGLGQAEETCVVEGKVTIEDIQPQSDFTLIAGNGMAEQGAEVCIDVDVAGFQDIQSSQFTIQWDDAVLDYSRVQTLNAGICDLTQNNFFPVGDDKLRVSWSCANGASVPDTSLFFQICFNAIGECNPPSSSALDFIDDSPILIEITDTDNNVIDPVVLISGSIGLIECMGTPLQCILNAVDNVNCKGEASGGIFVDFSGGEGAVSCSWTGPGGPYENCDLQGIFAGTYVLTATDEGGNSCTLEVEVMEPEEALTISGEANAASCGDGGDINVMVTGGTGNANFSWDPPLGNVEDPTNLEPGEYCVTVTDQNQCTTDMCFTVNDSAPSLAITGASTANISCDDTGSIDITVEGGCTPINFEWSFDNSTIGSNEDIADLTEVGTYTVVITDSSDPVQEVTMNYNITSTVSPLTIGSVTTTNISCSSLGSIDISVNGGCTPLNYNWTFNGDNVGSMEDLTNIEFAGTYTVNISDNSDPALSISMDYSITSSITDITVSGDVTGVSCSGESDGAINITVQGGCPTYTFAWDNGESTEDISGLSSGTYCVSVNDQFAEDEPVIMCFDVGDQGALTIDLIGIQHVTNIDGNNGVIDIEPNGGAGNYSFQWSPNGSNSEDQINVSPGEYCVTVTDENNCTANACYTVDWGAIFFDSCLATPTECSGECTGTIDCDIVGGCDIVEIRVNNVLVEGFPIMDLCADSYTITVLDACGNMDSEVIIIPEPGDLVLTAADVNCTALAENTGSIILELEGGMEPYTITWGGASACDGSLTCEGLGVGFYTVVVEDGNGCQSILQNIEIEECDNQIPVDCYEGRPIITPNGDGLNDQFLISCADLNDNQLYIYDRWGRLVFEQSNYDNTWEGIHANGNMLEDGGYMWVLEVTLPNGNRVLRRGAITILRTNF